MEKFKKALIEKFKGYDVDVCFPHETETFIKWSIKSKDKEIVQGSLSGTELIKSMHGNEADELFEYYAESSLNSYKEQE